MARVRKSTLSFDAITLEGSLLSSAKFAAIAERKDRKADEQEDADYSIPRGLTLRDETARYFRIGQALFRELHASGTPARHKTIEFTDQLLRGVFGFSDVQLVRAPKFHDDRLFLVTLEALNGRVPVVVVPPSDSLDHASNSLSQDRRRSAASALQDWLNADDSALWGLCTNGESLRLLRDNESLTRPAYLEADLRQIFEAEDYAGFSALWLVLHVSRFGRLGAQPADCPLERWRESGSKEGLAARDRLRDGVEAALLALGTGFLTNPANTELSARLREGTWPIDEFFRQLLRLVYRLIFLLAAEDRNLLHIPDASEEQRKLYAQGYSLGALRDRAIRRSGWDNFHDRWSGLKVTFRALANGEPRLGLPALGGIYATTATPELDLAHVSNRFLMEAIFRLAWLRDEGLLMPVNWRDMETEELGSVYESLLELTPRLSADGREFKFADGPQTKGNARKTSGSYYTPDSLVQVLLDTALDPVLDRVESESEDPIRSLLNVTVIDPACGSGHFLLAAARRIAKRVLRLRCGDIYSERDRLRALRDVVRSCIHGVDRYPMAVELTKVALWIETVEPGKPLGFLDANIRLGDSLLGIFSTQSLTIGIPDSAYKPLVGDDKAIAKELGKRNKDDLKGQARLQFTGGVSEHIILRPLAASFRALRELPEETAAEVVIKTQRFNSASHDPHLYSLLEAAHLYMAAFLLPKTKATWLDDVSTVVPTTADVWTKLEDRKVLGTRLGAAIAAAVGARCFHWPLEFPDVMDSGGFDVVLGNPPWERIKLQEKEFFAAREPRIAEAKNAAGRREMVTALKNAELGSRDRRLYDEYVIAKRTAEAASEFARVDQKWSGRFPLVSQGDINTYALFSELFTTLTKSSGQAGVIAPTGLVTDLGTAPFFRQMISERRLISVVGFENEEFLFTEVHNATKFGLFTFAGVGVTGGQGAEFRFLLRNIGQMGQSERVFRLNQKELHLLNPNTGTAPVFRSKMDAELARTLHERFPVLWSSSSGDEHNFWNLTFSRMFDMANDSGHFLGEASPGDDAPEIAEDVVVEAESANALPLYEGKMFYFYNHRHGTYENFNFKQGKQVKELPPPSPSQMADPSYEVRPRYWIAREQYNEWSRQVRWERQWLIAWRDITGGTLNRTCVVSALPVVAVGHTAPVLLCRLEPKYSAALLSLMSSIIFDYLVRLKIGGLHLTYSYLRQIPVPTPDYFTEASFDFIMPRVLELTYTSDSMASFARDLGYTGPPLTWDEARRIIIQSELDAWYARAYGLSRDELRYILDPADVMGPGYPSETFRVLKKSEVTKLKAYRTQRLILDAWDRIDRGELHKPEPYKRPPIGNVPPEVRSNLRPETKNQPSLQFAEGESE